MSYLGDYIDVIRCVQHAALVLTPRSASAHIAAAYRIPSFCWLPEDGENWHLDYPSWNHHRFYFEPEYDVQSLKTRIYAFVSRIIAP